jgi:transmembrane sensor
MTEHIDNIKATIRIAKAIDEDIREYKSFDVQAAYLKNRKKLGMIREKYTFTYYVLRIAAVLLLPLMISTGVLSYLYIRQLKQIDTISYLEASSAPGIVTQILLPDSSRVWLNAGSTLRYPSRFSEKDRNVQLSGEGYFEVQSNREHPFYVSLYNGIRVMAHGTKFNVNAYENADPLFNVVHQHMQPYKKRVASLLNQQQDHPQRAGGIRTLAQPPISITP